jgi:hypothetical protein
VVLEILTGFPVRHRWREPDELESIRCLKRFLARELYHLIQPPAHAATTGSAA